MSKNTIKRVKTKELQDYTDELILSKRQKVQKVNTKAADRSTGEQLKNYLRQLNENENFWELSTQRLDYILSKFWFAARTNKVDETTGELKKYMILSLRSLLYAINRNLKDHEYRFDITTSEAFLKSPNAFDDACKELKTEGYGHINHTPEIEAAGNLKYVFLMI